MIIKIDGINEQISNYQYMRQIERGIIEKALRKGKDVICSCSNNYITIDGVTYNGWQRKMIKKMINNIKGIVEEDEEEKVVNTCFENRPHALSHVTPEEVKDQYYAEQNRTLWETADHYGVSVITLRTFMARNSIPVKSRGPRKRKIMKKGSKKNE